MSDDGAFITAICDNPADDVPRLIFADYLDERGDPRGEFIRAQIALARPHRLGPDGQEQTNCDGSPSTGCSGCMGCETLELQCECWRGVLRRRERELLEVNWHPWSGVPFATYLGNYHDSGAVGVTFRRGFVEAVACDLGAWLAHGPAIVRQAPLRTVTLSDVSLARRLQPTAQPFMVVLPGSVALTTHPFRPGLELFHESPEAFRRHLSDHAVAWAKRQQPAAAGAG